MDPITAANQQEPFNPGYWQQGKTTPNMEIGIYVILKNIPNYNNFNQLLCEFIQGSKNTLFALFPFTINPDGRPGG